MPRADDDAFLEMRGVRKTFAVAVLVNGAFAGAAGAHLSVVTHPIIM
jgi:ABC-type uncharacterized transport system permease subunit